MTDPFLVPRNLLAAIPNGAQIVEIGAGARFATALDLAGLGYAVTVTDVDPRVLDAPAPLAAVIDDVLQPDAGLFAHAALIVSVRPPEEIQTALARLAAGLGVPLILRPLGNEWVEFTGILGPPRRVSGWLCYPPSG